MATLTRIWPAVVLGVVLTGATSQGSGSSTPFRWFEPDATVSPAELERMSRGEVIVKPLPSSTQQLGVFAVTEIGTSPEVFVEWIRHISQLQRSKAVAASGRFSNPPVFQDLDGLELDPRDLAAIRECRPGRCALKLSADEVQMLRPIADGGADAAIQYAFRRVLFGRLMANWSGGVSATGAPAEVFAALHANSPYIGRSDLRLAQWLNASDPPHPPEVESFYYWSKEYYASGKAMIALMQVGVTRGPRGGAAPEVAVVGKQLFASRYMNGMLTHITLARDPVTGARYMTYTNRAQLDVLKGILGGLVRTVINSRLRGDAATVLRSLRDRIESGPPKPSPGL